MTEKDLAEWIYAYLEYQKGRDEEPSLFGFAVWLETGYMRYKTYGDEDQPINS